MANKRLSVIVGTHVLYLYTCRYTLHLASTSVEFKETSLLKSASTLQLPHTAVVQSEGHSKSETLHKLWLKLSRVGCLFPFLSLPLARTISLSLYEPAHSSGNAATRTHSTIMQCYKHFFHVAVHVCVCH